MDEDMEMITEWPPPSTLALLKNRLDSEDLHSPPSKRRKTSQFYHDSEGLSASILLARWWKMCQSTGMYQQSSLPLTSNPNTLLRYIARLPACQEFIRKSIDELLSLPSQSFSAAVHYTLGTLYEKVNDIYSSQRHLSKAVQLNPQRNDYRWYLEKIHIQLEVRKTQQEVLNSVHIGRLLSQSFPEPLQVDRQSSDCLSVQEFFDQYALTSTPVIITNLVPKMTSQPWDLQHIRNIAGSRKVTLKRHVAVSVEWAKLEDATTIEISEFLDSLNQDTNEDKLYLFDWSLPLYCPELALQITIPHYFSGDFLKQTEPGSLYHDSWPSLFIAPQGLHSDLHVDAFGSNFWMALFEGRKRWVFFRNIDQPLLYPHYEHCMDPVFDINLHAPDFDEFPLTQLAQPIECILQPGELLFVPAGCPHRVENLDNSLAISANFVDCSNINLVKRHLHINSLNDPNAENLLQQLEKLIPF